MAEIHLIIGPMFSGKTTELLRVAKRLRSINLKVLLINYEEDTRYSCTEMKTHDKEGLPCIFTKNLFEIDISDYDIICINEAQFFTRLYEYCEYALHLNKSVYIAGLDGDYKQEKFGEVLDIIPLCNNIIKLHAFCKICGDGTPAHFTERLTNETEIKLIGSEDMYIPVCRKHLNLKQNKRYNY